MEERTCAAMYMYVAMSIIDQNVISSYWLELYRSVN